MIGLFNVVRAELFKATRKRRIYFFAALAWILPAFILLLGAYIAHTQIDIDDGGVTQEFIKILAAPITISSVNLASITISSFLTIVIALLSAFLIGEERNQKMWKTVLVAEPNRFTVLLGKIITAMLLIFFFLLVLQRNVESEVKGNVEKVRR